MYEPRAYRKNLLSSDLIPFEIRVKDTDFYVLSKKDNREKIRDLIIFYRTQIENYIRKEPFFKVTFKPVETTKDAPHIIRSMAESSRMVNVGPMAAIAGAVAEFVGKEIVRQEKSDVIIENGGDLFLFTTKERKVGILTKNKFFKDKLYIKVLPHDTPLGICTSSGKIGHSISLGKSDTVTIVSASVTLADALATAACNLIKGPQDIQKALTFIKSVPMIKGAVIICDNKIGACGNIEIAST
ncbi:UPF0280 family protein [bacterium]